MNRIHNFTAKKPKHFLNVFIYCGLLVDFQYQADEEFEIEKSRIVREKREKIQSRIKKSKSQLEQKKKV